MSGWVLPFSHKDTVCRVTNSFSAICSWVSPACCRRRLIFFDMDVFMGAPPENSIAKAGEKVTQEMLAQVLSLRHGLRHATSLVRGRQIAALQNAHSLRHSEPVITLAWESALSSIGKRIATPFYRTVRNDRLAFCNAALLFICSNRSNSYRNPPRRADNLPRCSRSGRAYPSSARVRK